MRLLITHPDLAPDLVSALNETDCIARRVGRDVVEVLVPWRLDGANRSHAATELLFFVKAWASKHPTFGATVLDGI